MLHHPFSGLDHEDPYKHLTTFYGLAGTLGASADVEETVFARLFPHSLIGSEGMVLGSINQCDDRFECLGESFSRKVFPEG